MIEDLLEYDAIKSAYTFNYIDKNVNIFITYDDKILKLDELKEQDVSQCMEVYKSSTSLSSFKLTCQKQYE